MGIRGGGCGLGMGVEGVEAWDRVYEFSGIAW